MNWESRGGAKYLHVVVFNSVEKPESCFCYCGVVKLMKFLAKPAQVAAWEFVALYPNL